MELGADVMITLFKCTSKPYLRNAYITLSLKGLELKGFGLSLEKLQVVDSDFKEDEEYKVL